MNKRQIKLSCYLEQLNIEVVKVEMILNQLNRLKNNQEIANYIIERDLLKTKCQLELSLASLCIILRKMCENQFITLNQERRKDINSIIHSNRFDFFEDDKVYVFSQKGQEEVNIIQLLDYAKKDGLKPEEIIAIGDSENDYSMLSIPGIHSVAMENACDMIRNICVYQTRANTRDGIAYIINCILADRENFKL